VAAYTALEKHACAACGAQAEWHPGRQALICPSCGTTAPYQLDSGSGELREIDLVQALRELPAEERGWLTERRSVRCRSCHAISVLDPARVGQRCDFCGSTELLDYEEIKAPIRPQGLLPFKVGQEQARDALRRWCAGRWFAPRGFKDRARFDRMRGVYLPYWTFDARVHCRWSAESGTYYYTNESYRDANGKSQTRRVRHVRWWPSAGELDHVFDDAPVPGTRGVDRGLLSALEPFATAELVPYGTAYLSGFVVEHYQVVLIEAAQSAREAMDERLRQLCAQQVPGDTHRNLQIEPEYTGQTFKHILLPFWLLAYLHRGKSYQAIVDGHSGRVAGHYPKSVWKVAALLLLAAIVALILARLS
jgi:hypothetical protein